IDQVDDTVQVGHVPLRFAAGSEKPKLEPPPGFSSNQISPRCPDMIARLIVKPSPMTLRFVVTNGSNRLPRSSSDKPVPLSVTVMTTLSSQRRPVFTVRRCSDQ